MKIAVKYLSECLESKKEQQQCQEKLRAVMLDKDELERQTHSLKNDLNKNSGKYAEKRSQQKQW